MRELRFVGAGHARPCGLASVTMMTLTSRGDGK